MQSRDMMVEIIVRIGEKMLQSIVTGNYKQVGGDAIKDLIQVTQMCTEMDLLSFRGDVDIRLYFFVVSVKGDEQQKNEAGDKGDQASSGNV